MIVFEHHYIDGKWVRITGSHGCELANPATGRMFAKVRFGSVDDADVAVEAARKAFPAFSKTSKRSRLAMLRRIGEALQRHRPLLVDTIVEELGAPISLCEQMQVPVGELQAAAVHDALDAMEFRERRGNHQLLRQPAGVATLITSWNWPVNGIAGVLFPALAAGCTVVWKPSELAVSSATALMKIFETADLPAGVINLLIGDGQVIGRRLSTHQDVDVISFTGSVQTGIAIAQQAAPGVKRVVQELGGKSPYIVLPDAGLSIAVRDCVAGISRNSGQNCNAPSRLLVSEAQYEEAVDIAVEEAKSIVVGDPRDARTQMGPVKSQAQWQRLQEFVETGLREGAALGAGQLGKPAGMERGYFMRPVVFRDVDNAMSIAQDEAFGPILCVIPYKTIEDAIRIANDSRFGLSAYIAGSDRAAVMSVAREVNSGAVHINGAPFDFALPFGGFRMSGNGRKFGREGIEEYLEAKALFGPV